MVQKANCPKCGAEIELAAVPTAESTPTKCGTYGVGFSVVVTEDGAQTVLHPPPPTEDRATKVEDSQTMVVNTSASTGESNLPRTVVRGVLMRRSAPPEEGRLILRKPRVSVGREVADVLVPDIAMSSTHFEIEERDGEFFLRDLESKNGTFLNGNKVRAAQLAKDDEIAAGRTTFTFTTIETIAAD